MANYAILRVEKIHTRRQLQAVADHNNRDTPKGTEHADPEGAAGLIGGDRETVAAWDGKMAGAGLDPKKQRKDAVLALEWVATASPGWWATATQGQREDWALDTMAFIEEQAGGRDNILSTWWHDDETTPHIHVASIPLVEKERGAKGAVRKGRKRPDPVKGWGLSCKDIIGGSSGRLVQLQDDYAAAVAHHGLARGVPRRETGARNKPVAQWRAEQARMADEMAADRVATKAARREAETMMAKAAAALEYAEGMGQAVRADAKALGKAIHFPAYADSPASKEAREAIRQEQERQKRAAEARKATRLRMDRVAVRAAPESQQGGQERGR